MSDYDPSLSSRQLPVVRRLKLFLGLLLLSNVALGGFGFYYIRTIDTKYSDLINRTVPALTDLERLTARSADAMLKTNPVLFAGSEESRLKMLGRTRDALETQRALRARLLSRDLFATNSTQQLRIKNAGDNFDRTAGETIGLIEAGRIEEAVRHREQSLRPVFDLYLERTMEAADRIESHSQGTTDTLSSRTRAASEVMLGLGGWPLLIPAALLAVTLMFVTLLVLNLYSTTRRPA